MTLLVTGYESKKQLKENIGKRLVYRETSMFGNEYKDNGKFVVVHRPALRIQPKGREFFAEVTMKDGLIAAVI